MRFAFTAAQSNCTWAELAALWDTADQLDVFTTGWVYDHFYPLRTGPEEPTLEGWSCLAMLLARTKRLRGGVLVTGLPTAIRQSWPTWPSLLTSPPGVDWSSASAPAGSKPNARRTASSWARSTERFDRLEEALTVIHSLLTRPTTDFEGRYYRLRDAWCEPKAMQQPHPPIVLGGKGERRLLPLVARFADHWNYSGEDPAEFARLRERLAELCDEQGRRIGDLTLSANVRPALNDPGHVAGDAAAFGEAGADMVGVLIPRPYDARFLDQIASILDPLR